MKKKIMLTCQYCGHKEKADYSTVKWTGIPKCYKCKGKDVKVQEYETNPFGYEDEPEEDKGHWPTGID